MATSLRPSVGSLALVTPHHLALSAARWPPTTTATRCTTLVIVAGITRVAILVVAGRVDLAPQAVVTAKVELLEGAPSTAKPLRAVPRHERLSAIFGVAHPGCWRSFALSHHPALRHRSRYEITDDSGTRIAPAITIFS